MRRQPLRVWRVRRGGEEGQGPATEKLSENSLKFAVCNIPLMMGQ